MEERTHQIARSLSDIAVRPEAEEGRASARPQAPKNRRRVRWNTLRIFLGREQSRCLDIVRRSRKVNVGQAPSFSRALVALTCLVMFQAGPVTATDSIDVAQEQRIEIVIRDSAFLLTKPAPTRLGMSTVIVLRNEDIIRHGFTSPMLFGLLVHAEGEGIASYGKGVEGFYVDPGKTLVIRFTTERPGSYIFRCDLHPQMKGEFLMLNVQAV